MPSGTVEAIHIAPEAASAVESRDSVEAVAGRGLRGDRYFQEAGTFTGVEGGGRHLTLIETEAVVAIEQEAGIELEPGEHRRNLTTSGIALNHLVDREFSIGEARFMGIRLCEPCTHLQSLTGKDEIISALLHRGGLRADIVESGTIGVGDRIRAD